MPDEALADELNRMMLPNPDPRATSALVPLSGARWDALNAAIVERMIDLGAPGPSASAPSPKAKATTAASSTATAMS